MIGFEAAGRTVREIAPGDLPRAQAFLEANPEYEWMVNGHAPKPDAAAAAFAARAPTHLGVTAHAMLGAWRSAQSASLSAGAAAPVPGPGAGAGPADGGLDALLILDRDLGAAGVWHLAYFQVATRLHGSGFAPALFAALEREVQRQGARWFRLSVLAVNPRGHAFWRRMGFGDVRVRENVDVGARRHDARVMLKSLGDAPGPLQGAALEAYLARVPRDRPGSALP